MKVVEVLHMNGGHGETSYAANSKLQQKAITMTSQITEQAITRLMSSTNPNRLAIADLGCSSGPNTFFAMSKIVKSFVRISRNLGRQPPEFQVFLNDLPENDFNSIFTSLPVFKKQMKKELTVDGHELSMFISAVPGSFYGRLFPVGSLHFVHSSYSLHWLSQVPDGLVPDGLVELNKGNVSYGSNSPRGVFDLYLGQFRKDFAEFLRCRALELVSGGKMVLTFLGRKNDDTSRCCYSLDLISITLNQMASEGLINMERLGSFNVPMYMPSPMEVEAEVKKQSSFTINYLEVKQRSYDPYEGEVDLPETLKDSGSNVAKCVRAVLEPLLVRHFDLRTQIVDEVFLRYGTIVSERLLSDYKTKYANNVIVSLTKL
ncbi:Salicylate carboxymethyltransferase [Linum grandiflorum]